MEPMQASLDSRADGEWWASMEEVFHTDQEFMKRRNIISNADNMMKVNPPSNRQGNRFQWLLGHGYLLYPVG